MAIHIQSIHAERLGPLQSFSADLGQINLIFGSNESGKTYLVEFLLQSLFRQTHPWHFRKTAGEGRVMLSGLQDQLVPFSPAKKKKLEDYWQEQSTGFPLNLTRLLVVKGGDLALTKEAPGGVDRDVLKRVLTSQDLLDEIWQSLQQTIRTASLEKGRVLGNNKGKIKDLNQLEMEIEALTSLLDQIEQHYSRGPARQTELALEALQSRLAQQDTAKRYQAFRYWKELEQLSREEGNLNQTELIRLRGQIRDHGNLAQELKDLNRNLQQLTAEAAGLPWIETALTLWKEAGLEKKRAPSTLWGAAGLLSLITGLALLVMTFTQYAQSLFWIGLAGAVTGMGLIVFFGIKMLSWSEQLDDTAERIAIQTEFEEKFNHQARGLADLQEQKEILREKAIIHQTTKSLFDEKTHQLKMLQQSIQNDFDRLIGHTLSAAEWETALSDLSSNLEKMRSRALELKLKLEHLQIDPKDYLMEDPGNQFDPQIVEELHQQKDQLESDLGINRSTLENLKARACERTGDEITAPWPDVYTNLKTLLSQRRRERQGLLAEIIAGIGLTAVLTQLREEEDQKIVQALQDKEVTRTLHNITGDQYQMDLKKGLIVRQGRISSFALEDLSTGAREQALLALRLGFAARICGGDPLFLLLDDAFQHSDWERREGLVQSTINLASNGWQIIYLSMDDHIRNLYQEKAGPIFKDQFKYFELP